MNRTEPDGDEVFTWTDVNGTQREMRRRRPQTGQFATYPSIVVSSQILQGLSTGMLPPYDSVNAHAARTYACDLCKATKKTFQTTIELAMHLQQFHPEALKPKDEQLPAPVDLTASVIEAMNQ